MFYCFIYIQNKWKFLKKEMHVYKLSLCTYNQFLGLLQHFVAMYVWTENGRNVILLTVYNPRCNKRMYIFL